MPCRLRLRSLLCWPDDEHQIPPDMTRSQKAWRRLGGLREDVTASTQLQNARTRCLALFLALARCSAFGGSLFAIALRMNAEIVP